MALSRLKPGFESPWEHWLYGEFRILIYSEDNSAREELQREWRKTPNWILNLNAIRTESPWEHWLDGEFRILIYSEDNSAREELQRERRNVSCLKSILNAIRTALILIFNSLTKNDSKALAEIEKDPDFKRIPVVVLTSSQDE